MIRDITIGQYYPEDSIIHRLDPRVKIISTFIYIISLFVFDSIVSYVLLTLMLAGVIRMSKVPFKYIVKGLKGIMMILIFTVIVSLLFTDGDHRLLKVGIICISLEGITRTFYLSIRLIYLVLGSSLMTFTTTPNMLTDGIESVLGPLKIFKVPVGDVAMMMSIALRFIPILVDEADKIMKAQMSRGADFENGNFLKKIYNMLPLLIPLFVSAFRRAGDLAQAMEARCYQGGNTRTKMKPLKYEKRDYEAYGVVFAALVMLIIVKIVL